RQPIHVHRDLGGVPLQHAVDGLPSEGVTAGTIDEHLQFLDVAQGLQVLVELLWRHFVAPPRHVRDLAIKQKLPDFRGARRGPELPELTPLAHPLHLRPPHYPRAPSPRSRRAGHRPVPPAAPPTPAPRSA